jgi:hypothetical protein
MLISKMSVGKWCPGRRWWWWSGRSLYDGIILVGWVECLCLSSNRSEIGGSGAEWTCDGFAVTDIMIGRFDDAAQAEYWYGLVAMLYKRKTDLLPPHPA